MSALQAHVLRERRRKLLDPTMGLWRTHINTTANQPGLNLYSTAATPMTWAITFEVTAASPNGILFEIGKTDDGVALWLDGTAGELGFCAGRGAGVVPNEGVDGVVSIDDTVGRRYKVVCSTIPGDGTIRVWVNGDLLIREQAVAGTFSGTPPVWATGPGGGAIGSVAGSANDRVPVGSLVELSNAIIIGDSLAAGDERVGLSSYYNQRPRHYYNAKVG